MASGQSFWLPGLDIHKVDPHKIGLVFFCLFLKKFTDVEHDAQRVIGYVLAF